MPADPLHTYNPSTDKPNPAADLIRTKLASLYGQEPTAKQEVAEVKHLTHTPSKHQAHMQQLMNSGKSLADIQVSWHEYYQQLSDTEKHEVWNEFYAEAERQKNQHPIQQQTQKTPIVTPHTPRSRRNIHKRADERSEKQIKSQLIERIKANGMQKKTHFKSLGFGLLAGCIAIFITLFGFFNERFIAPFISPSRSTSSTPLIIDANSPVGTESRIIIPKINVEIPVVYDEPTIEEHAVQQALERGVVHYGVTENPGEKGNSVIFGHSSNNILNKGKYKFAFVLLHRMEIGDTFMLEKDGKRYVYKVFDKKVVKPNEVSVLNDVPNKTATATLITCDPPGTANNRLIVSGEQISPDPNANIASSQPAITSTPETLPSDAPGLWERFTNWLFG